MFFFKKKAKITEEKVQELIQKLEKAYMAKDIDEMTEMFHPDNRQISFLNHFSLVMNFQIYNIQSEILNLEIVDLSEQEATFTYARKHLYTCINKNDENEENPNNISSYYVQIQAEGSQIWITKYSRFSELFLDAKGEILPYEQAVVPAAAQYYENMKRFIEPFTLDGFLPATYYLYSDSEFIGYYPEKERFLFVTSEKFTVDYFTEMDADSIAEHTDIFLSENSQEYGAIIEQEENHSIIEIKIMSNGRLLHELVLSILASDGFYMIRYLKNNISPIEDEVRQSWIEQMRVSATKIKPI